jgi:membrane peptidoglycan carboxypeptidase
VNLARVVARLGGSTLAMWAKGDERCTARQLSVGAPSPELPCDGVVPPGSPGGPQGPPPVVPERSTPRWALPVWATLAVSAAIVYEARTSALQSALLTRYAAHLTFHVAPGPSDRIAYPDRGPFDRRRGYTLLPEIVDGLRQHGWRVSEQARQSPELVSLIERGVAPPFPEPARAGAVVLDKEDRVLYGPATGAVFRDYADVPPLLAQALVFIENRELASPPDPRTNPAVEWDRLVRAGAVFLLRRAGFGLDSEGGSTLATQMEKYRHSVEGRTDSAGDKVRQMLGASLKAYRDGTDTRARRREIVAGYLNTMPLAAAPGFGEVYGMGDGLRAWFALDLEDVKRRLREGPQPARAAAFKHALALICAVRQPARLLIEDRGALEQRVDGYLRLLAREGHISEALAREALQKRLVFRDGAVPPRSRLRRPDSGKAVNGVRQDLLNQLGVSSLYDLDRLHLTVDTTLDAALQEEVGALLANLKDPEFLEAQGLRAERLLRTGDPVEVLYSVLLFERTPQGNLLRLQADSLDTPFDLNEDMKLELGSTAKLRTLSHYLELVARLHRPTAGRAAGGEGARTAAPSDPITRWAVAVLEEEPEMTLEQLLERALSRKYPADPGEVFFTGGGAHRFHNFDRREDGLVLTVREATRRSNNLAFIRLMRDLAAFHEARLPYDAAAVLRDPSHPDRRRLLEEAADQEALTFLSRALRRFRGADEGEVLQRLLGGRAGQDRALSIVYFAWAAEPTQSGLSEWLHRWTGGVAAPRVARLWRAYGNPRLTLADYGYLLRRHPVDLWVAGRLRNEPDATWDALVHDSAAARRTAMAWLFRARNRTAQDRRLRVRIEQDAFARMARDWRRLGFPFATMVPSLASAIGSSSDRPAALAELMGIIVNDGVRQPAVRVTRLRFAEDTPYHTALRPEPVAQRVMEPAVARAVRGVLAEVVAAGTARRVSGVILGRDGHTVVVGGKTGSGDNRVQRVGRGGRRQGSIAVNRTATFVFYAGDRHFGVITAHVPGPAADAYTFTSALPVSLLKLMAPALQRRL